MNVRGFQIRCRLLDGSSWTVVFGACLLVLVGCGGRAAQTPVDSGQVIAEDRLGPITVADLDAFILDLPPNSRWQAGEADAANWYGELTRRIAIDRLLYDEAVLLGIDQDPAFAAREHQQRRTAHLRHYLKAHRPAEAVPDENELRAFYDEHLDRYQRDERREVYHIFKHYGPDGEREGAVAELEALRERVLAGESFSLLAGEASDSETRHQGGRLGLVNRGLFPEDFDRVVFALEPGEPSGVIETRDGAHLFLVASLLEARSLSFEEVRQSLAEEILLGRLDDHVAEVVSELPAPEPYFAPSEEELLRILRAGDPRAVVLQVGGFELSAGEFQEHVAQRRRQLGPRGNDPGLPSKVLDEIRYGEIVLQHYESGNGADGDRAQIAAQIERQRRRELIEHYARRKMTTFLERDAERVQEHYDNNQLRFATPLRVQVHYLTVPAGSHPPATMERLERARADLDAGRLDLAALASELGGEVRDLGLLTSAQLQRLDRSAQRFAFLLKPGEHSPPYQLGDRFALFRVDERQEPVPRPLARTRDRVVQDLLEASTASVFREVSDQLLEEAEFKLYEDRLTQIGPLVSAAASAG